MKSHHFDQSAVNHNAEGKTGLTYQQVTHEENQTYTKKSFFRQTLALLANIGQIIFGWILDIQDAKPIITRLEGQAGETFWKIYDPNTRKNFYCMTNYEVMDWLERHNWKQ